MIEDRLFLDLIEDSNADFSGWDFSFVTETGRMQSELLPWSYGSLVIPQLKHANALLDMGTGGGELLSKLRPLPKTVKATEGYKPNVPIAKQTLEPLGITVEEIEDDEQLPFQDNEFDLIINKHESFSPTEIKRLLSREGIFLTQQVGGLDCAEINQLFDAPLYEFKNWNLTNAISDFSRDDFTVMYKNEAFPVQRFYDIGAVVYYLKAIPWQVPNFTQEAYMEQLYRIHTIIQDQGYFEVKQHRFIFQVQKK